MFVVKDGNGRKDCESYKSMYFNCFLYYIMRSFPVMQVRVMATCKESQTSSMSAQSKPKDVTGVVYHLMSVIEAQQGSMGGQRRHGGVEGDIGGA